MARMLTEEEVQKIEEQRELRDRAKAAGSTAGMSWNERKRFEEAQERQMWDQRYRETHGGLSRAEVQAAGPNGSGRQYGAIKRGFELQAARQHEMDRLGKELATREKEAYEKRMGMREQGRDAAEMNKDAAIRAAELQTASAKEIAGINAKSALDVETIRGKNNLEVAKEQGGASVDVATVTSEGNVEAARVQANAQAAKEYAQNMMRQRQVDQETAMEFAQKRAALIEQIRKNSKNKRTGVFTVSEEDAARIVDERLKGQMPGKPRKI